MHIEIKHQFNFLKSKNTCCYISRLKQNLYNHLNEPKSYQIKSVNIVIGKLRVRGNFINLINEIYKKLRVNTVFNCEMMTLSCLHPR